jgi:arsenate reductase
MASVEIWHNPRCSKSRAALELLRERGVDPKVVLYLEAPPSVERLEEVLRLLGAEPRGLMRKNEAPYSELGLADATVDRGTLLRAMTEHPVLIERPLVIVDGRAVVARPPERALEML